MLDPVPDDPADPNVQRRRALLRKAIEEFAPAEGEAATDILAKIGRIAKEAGGDETTKVQALMDIAELLPGPTLPGLPEGTPDAPSHPPGPRLLGELDDGPDDPSRPRRLDWAKLLKRAYAVDVLFCQKCHGRMILMNIIDDERIARKILTHLGLPARAPPRGRPWRPAQQILPVVDDAGRFDGIDPLPIE